MRHALALVLLLGACRGDETLSAFADRAVVYELQQIDGEAFGETATLSMQRPGRVSGSGPCNRYAADLLVPYPWFEIGPIASSRAACPALEAERAVFEALSAMQFAEAQGAVLILSNGAGREMVYRARAEPR